MENRKEEFKKEFPNISDDELRYWEAFMATCVGYDMKSKSTYS
jgi:hypothetical protein